MDATAEWGGVASLVLLLIVVVADALLGSLPGVRAVFDGPLDGVRRLTEWFDGRLNRARRGGEARRLRGLLIVLVVAFLAWLVALLLGTAAGALPHGWMIEAATLVVLLRQGDVVARMTSGWRQLAARNADDARAAIRPLIRFDTRGLDDYGVARAAIEGGTARFCDRFVATLFWYLLLGLPGAAVCRSLNAVADVVGRRSPRHASFGFVAARVDDVLNLVPAIITGPLIGIAAIFVPRASAAGAFRGWLDDLRERGIRSDFRGEGAMAGALGVALGGPRHFGDQTVPGGWIGDGRARAQVGDVQRAALVLSIACLLVAAALATAIVDAGR